MAEVKMKIMLPGDKISGQFIRPNEVSTVCILDPICGEAVGIVLTPYDGEEFNNPVTLVMPTEKIDSTAQERLPKPQGGAV